MSDDERAPTDKMPVAGAGDGLIGQSIGTYRIMRQIGRGGMGTVYEAVHDTIGQRVAVKVLATELSGDPKYVSRFFDEARVVSIVKHPGLVKIFDFNKLADGSIYIMMELLEGESLWDRYERLRKQEKWLSQLDILRIARQIASTLAAVHEKGILHRDLKPENVILVADSEAAGGERAKLLDFGIAKFTEEALEKRRTTGGLILGTPIYMSPEQCAARASLNERADVYSLGVMLYEMVARRPPFDCEEAGRILGMHMFQDANPLSKAVPGTPQALSQLVVDMLAKEPDARPTMNQVVARIEAIRDSGVFGVISTTRQGTVTVPRRRLALAVRLIPVVLLLVGLLAWRMGERHGERKVSEQTAPPQTIKLVLPTPATSVPAPAPPKKELTAGEPAAAKPAQDQLKIRNRNRPHRPAPAEKPQVIHEEIQVPVLREDH